MIDADLAVVNTSELLTLAGPVPRRGARQAELGVVAEGCVAARDGVVVFAGDAAEYRRRVRPRPDAVIIDASGGTVLPGFVDAHTHLPFAGSREQEFAERLRGVRYEEIAARGGGILSTVRSTRAADPDDLVRLGLARLDRMLLHGTTTVEAKSGYGLSFDDEIKQLEVLRRLDALHPIDVVPTLLAAHAVPPEHRTDREAYVRLIVERIIPEVARRGLARFCDVFVEDIAFRPDEAERILTAAARSGLGLRVHADQLRDGGGALLAARLHAASADHLEHVTEEGLRALAAAGTVAVVLPGAAFFMRSPAAGLGRRLVDAEIPVALGTDLNPGTCPTEAMTAVLPLACLDAGLTPAEAIAAATANAAASLGLGERAGSLEPGKDADLIVLDAPNHLHLIYHFGVNLCRTVVKRGRVAVLDGVAQGRS